MGKLISWNGVMSAAMNMPGVKVDRLDFLQRTFTPFKLDENIFVSKKPSDVFSIEAIDYMAKKVIRNHTTKVTAISGLAGIPGGFAMIGTVPADLAQYYWHFLVVAQKLAYLYGWPDLKDEDGNLGEAAEGVLTAFVGIGLGVDGAAKVARKIAQQAALHWQKKLAAMALTKTAWYPILKKIASNIGIKLTRNSVGKAAGKVIPLLGGILSGVFTFATFKPMANKLHKELRYISCMQNNFANE